MKTLTNGEVIYNEYNGKYNLLNQVGRTSGRNEGGEWITLNIYEDEHKRTFYSDGKTIYTAI